MIAADDTHAALQTKVAEPVGIPMKPLLEDELVQPNRQPTGLRGAA